MFARMLCKPGMDVEPFLLRSWHARESFDAVRMVIRHNWKSLYYPYGGEVADSNPLCAGLGAEQELCLERVNRGMLRSSSDAATLASNTVLIQHGTQVTTLTTWPELLAFLGLELPLQERTARV